MVGSALPDPAGTGSFQGRRDILRALGKIGARGGGATEALVGRPPGARGSPTGADAEARRGREWRQEPGDRRGALGSGPIKGFPRIELL